MTLLQEFKQFIMKGNLVELAVAFIIGTAFAALVKAFIADLITPIIALIFGKPDFGTLTFTINKSHFFYGDFINVAITFVSIAFVVFFFVVKPVNALLARRKTGEDTESETTPCTECLSEIPRQARKCAFCASVQEASA